MSRPPTLIESASRITAAGNKPKIIDELGLIAGRSDA